MHWGIFYCPKRRYSCYDLLFSQGLLVQDDSGHGQKQALCRAYAQRLALTYSTAYLGLDTTPEFFEHAVWVLAEGTSIHATARIVQRDKDTVCAWWHRAARQCRLVMMLRGKNCHVTGCQWDVLWSVVHTKAHHLLITKRLCERYGDAWVWVPFTPAWRLVVAFVVDKRRQEHAHRLLKRVVAVTDTRMPFSTSDQLSAYEETLLAAYDQ